MNTEHKGVFITFEGGEGSGKSTIVPQIVDFLRSAGLAVLSTREPGGSVGGELIRDLLVKGDVHRWDSVTEALLLFAQRRDHLVSTIWPALDGGLWVICDRYVDSTLAYQGYGHQLDLDALRDLYTFIAGDFQPALTFIMDVDPRVGLQRAASRRDNEDRFERMDLEFHNRVREGYRRLAQTDLNRYVIIDASQELDQVFAQVLLKIKEKFFA